MRRKPPAHRGEMLKRSEFSDVIYSYSHAHHMNIHYIHCTMYTQPSCIRAHRFGNSMVLCMWYGVNVRCCSHQIIIHFPSHIKSYLIEASAKSVHTRALHSVVDNQNDRTCIVWLLVCIQCATEGRMEWSPYLNGTNACMFEIWYSKLESKSTRWKKIFGKKACI